MTQRIQSISQSTVDAVAGLLARYGLVIVIAWFGGMKFTNFEAEGIQPLVSESPFMSWCYDIFSVYTFSVLLGVFEIAAAVLIAVKPWWPKLSLLGSALAIVLIRRDDQLPIHHPRRFRRIRWRLPAAVPDRRVSHQGHRIAWHFGVDACRCAEGYPQQSRRLLTGSRNLAMTHWRA